MPCLKTFLIPAEFCILRWLGYKRSGTLWEGRFKSNLVDKEDYFLIVTRYIEFNPIRAKMVAKPESYPWSSYHQHALGKHIKLLTEHICYLNFGDSPQTRLSTAM